MMVERLEQLADVAGASSNPSAVGAVAALFGMKCADYAEIEMALGLASRLIRASVMTPEALDALQHRSGGSFFVTRAGEGVTGFFGYAPLVGAGVQDAEGFDPLRLDLETIASPGQRPSSIYMLGAAGADTAARRAVITTTAAINASLFWALPIYTRIATKAGERVLLDRLGFERVGRGELAVRLPRTGPLHGFERG